MIGQCKTKEKTRQIKLQTLILSDVSNLYQHHDQHGHHQVQAINLSAHRLQSNGWMKSKEKSGDNDQPWCAAKLRVKENSSNRYSRSQCRKKIATKRNATER